MPRSSIAGNPAFNLSPFILEWFAGNKMPNQLPISAVCNCRCLFCSNHANPFPVVAGAFRDLEDIKLQLCSMAANDNPIRMSDSLPGRISEGEALLHPRLFEILDLVRRKFFYNTLCFTTNGSMLDEAFLKRLAAFRPVEITVSLHSTVPEIWAKIFSKKVRDAKIAINAVPLLKRFRIDSAGVIVPLPQLCGWDGIERTYEYLVTSGAKVMTLFWPGYTVRTPAPRLKDLECSIEEFTDIAARMKKKFQVPLHVFPDMASELQVQVETILRKTLKGNPKTRAGPFGRVIWLSSRAAFSRLEKVVAECGREVSNRHHVVPADNFTYGGNIIASGLLMAGDFIRAGLSALTAWPDADLFLVPSTPFDSLLRDLAGTPAYQIAEQLGRPVWLVQNDGTIDALLSRRLVSRRKALDAGLEKLMETFNRVRAGLEEIDAGLDLVALYPLATPQGLLDRQQLKEMIREDRNRARGPSPVRQRFEKLDESRGLCLEQWNLKEPERSLSRWTRLVKKGSDWRIESIEEGILS